MSKEMANDLTALAAQINQEHLEASATINQSLQHARRAGELLTQAKAQLGHGEWGGWLDQNFGGSVRTAQTYMRIARDFGELESKTQRVAHLPLREALALLAEPKDAEPQAEAVEESQSEFEAEPSVGTRPSAKELAAVQHMLESVARQYLNFLNVMAAAFIKASPTPPAGYSTWQEFIDAEVITPVGLNFDLMPSMSREDWPGIFRALGEFQNALAEAGKIEDVAGPKGLVRAARGSTGRRGAGIGFIPQLRSLGMIYHTGGTCH